MKAPILYLLSFFASIHSLKSCDICGCGIRDASFNMGFAQSIRSNILLFGIQHLQLNTRAFSNNQPYTVTDNVNRLPIQYLYQLNPKWQIQFQTEIQHVSRQNAFNENQNWQSTNPGDLFVTANYRIIDNRKNIFTPHHFMWLGGINVKAPTGHYQIRDAEKRLLPIQLQAGNGAYGVGVQTNIAYRYQNWGLNSLAQYSYNATNEVGYQQGSQTQLSLGLNYVFRGKSKHTVIPQIALNLQQFDEDKQYGNAVLTSGATLTNLAYQVEWIYNSWYILAQFQKPILKELPLGAPSLNQLAQFRIGYIIPEKKIMPSEIPPK